MIRGIALSTFDQLMMDLEVSAQAEASALECLDSEILDALAGAPPEAWEDHPRFFQRLVALGPERFHGMLDVIDPSGPLGVAFEGAPYDAVAHWAGELRHHKAGIPELEQGQPADTLAAALVVLGRSGGPRALSRIEEWLTWAKPQQLEAARRVLGSVGIGIARGQRAIDVWCLPAKRLKTAEASDCPVVVDPTPHPASCGVCGESLVVVAQVDQSLLPGLGLRGPRLPVICCPTCLAAGEVTYGHADGSAPMHLQPSSSADLRQMEGIAAAEGEKVEGAPDKGEPAEAERSDRLELPTLGTLVALPCAKHDDGLRPDRQALNRIGGAPAIGQTPRSIESPVSGEPMIFVGQIALQTGVLLLWYCSEDGLLASILARYPSVPGS